MSKHRKSKAAKAESPKLAIPQAVPAPQASLKGFGGVVLEIGRSLSKSIPDATKPLPPISCDAHGRETYPLIGKATPQEYAARLLAVKRFMASMLPGGRYSFAPGGVQWDRTKWEDENGQTFPLSMQEAAALSEKIGYMLATDFVNARFSMDAAVLVLSKAMSRQRQSRNLQAAYGVAPPSEPLVVQERKAGAQGNRSQRLSVHAEPARLELFQKAVGIVYNTGQTMEALPSTYFGKCEVALRDHFISVLRTHFDDVSGERFNKTGKTDIFVEDQKVAVLVAECKIWSGTKGYLDAIDQLLSYLTWRDAMAAVLLFVQTKELGPVLQQVASATRSHRSFVKPLSDPADGWYEFELQQNEDPVQAVRLAVLCFHFPSKVQR